MTKRRRVYTDEFKIEALKMVDEQELSYAEAARQLGVHANLLRYWQKQYDEQGEQAFLGHGKRTAVETEVERLQAENRRLQQECEFLKKATAYFAKEQR